MRTPLCISIVVFVSSLPAPTLSAQTAAEKFKNVTALKDMPADQMGKVMNIISQSLGVNCQHCHAGTDFAKEHVGQKDTAREMIELTFKLNREVFKSPEGRAQITCYTCHHGQAQPARDIDFGVPRVLTNKAIQPTVPPKVNDVIERYRTALGDPQKVASITSLKLTGKRVEPNGQQELEEFIWRASGYSQLTTNYGQLPIRETVDGDKVTKTVGEKVIELKPDEARQILMESRLLLGQELFDHVDQFEYVEHRQTDDLQVIVLKREPGDQFLFDTESGLLVRRVSSLPTLLGSFDYQVEYENYQALEGVMLPRLLRFSTPNIHWVRTIESAESPFAPRK